MVMDLASQSLKITALIGAPMLLSSMVIGLMVSLFQAVTQINEQTLTFIPKILVIGLCLMFFGPWMLDMILNFTRELFINMPYWVAGE